MPQVLQKIMEDSLGCIMFSPVVCSLTWYNTIGTLAVKYGIEKVSTSSFTTGKEFAEEIQKYLWDWLTYSNENEPREENGVCMMFTLYQIIQEKETNICHGMYDDEADRVWSVCHPTLERSGYRTGGAILQFLMNEIGQHTCDLWSESKAIMGQHSLGGGSRIFASCNIQERKIAALAFDCLLDWVYFYLRWWNVSLHFSTWLILPT